MCVFYFLSVSLSLPYSLTPPWIDAPAQLPFRAGIINVGSLAALSANAKRCKTKIKKIEKI